MYKYPIIISRSPRAARSRTAMQATCRWRKTSTNRTVLRKGVLRTPAAVHAFPDPEDPGETALLTCAPCHSLTKIPALPLGRPTIDLIRETLDTVLQAHHVYSHNYHTTLHTPHPTALLRSPILAVGARSVSISADGSRPAWRLRVLSTRIPRRLRYLLSGAERCRCRGLSARACCWSDGRDMIYWREREIWVDGLSESGGLRGHVCELVTSKVVVDKVDRK
ncbi:hypothetical protein V8E53_004097 [Lactarius tabidus]